MGSLSDSSYESAGNKAAFVKAARKNPGFTELIGHPFYQETMNHLSEVMGLPVERYVQLSIDRARKENPDRDDWEVARQEKETFDNMAQNFSAGKLDDEPEPLYNALRKAGDRMGNAMESLISGEPQEGETAFSFGMPSENEQVSWAVPQGIKGVPDDGDSRFVRKIPGNPQYNGDPGFSIGSKSGYDFDRGFSMMPPATNEKYNQRGFVFPNIKNGMRRGLQGPVNFNSRLSKEDNPFSPRLEQIIEEAVRSKMRYSGNNQNARTVRGFQNLPFTVEQGNEPEDFRYLSDTMNGNMGTNEPNVTLSANVGKNSQKKKAVFAYAQFDKPPVRAETDYRILKNIWIKYPPLKDSNVTRPKADLVRPISVWEHPAIPGSGEYNLFVMSLYEVDKSEKGEKESKTITAGNAYQLYRGKKIVIDPELKRKNKDILVDTSGVVHISPDLFKKGTSDVFAIESYIRHWTGNKNYKVSPAETNFRYRVKIGGVLSRIKRSNDSSKELYDKGAEIDYYWKLYQLYKKNNPNDWRLRVIGNLMKRTYSDSLKKNNIVKKELRINKNLNPQQSKSDLGYQFNKINKGEAVGINNIIAFIKSSNGTPVEIQSPSKPAKGEMAKKKRIGDKKAKSANAVRISGPNNNYNCYGKVFENDLGAKYWVTEEGARYLVSKEYVKKDKISFLDYKNNNSKRSQFQKKVRQGDLICYRKKKNKEGIRPFTHIGIVKQVDKSGIILISKMSGYGEFEHEAGSYMFEIDNISDMVILRKKTLDLKRNND